MAMHVVDLLSFLNGISCQLSNP